MAEDSTTLVLEISRLENQLKMSVYEQRELVHTVRRYSQCPVNFQEINKLCREASFILNKAGKSAAKDLDLINGLKKSSHLLWDQLLTRSVKDRLKITIIKELVLSLDEELVSIPWEMLFDSSENKRLEAEVIPLLEARRHWKGEVRGLKAPPLKMVAPAALTCRAILRSES